MRVQIQSVRSTKPVENSKAVSEEKNNNKHEKSHDILISSYDKKKTMYTDQTGKIPHSSSWSNKYHMIIHYINRNSKWVEPIKDITEVEMILGRAQALECLKLSGIIPNHQVLDNESSGAYKDAI